METEIAVYGKARSALRSIPSIFNGRVDLDTKIVFCVFVFCVYGGLIKAKVLCNKVIQLCTQPLRIIITPCRIHAGADDSYGYFCAICVLCIYNRSEGNFKSRHVIGKHFCKPVVKRCKPFLIFRVQLANKSKGNRSTNIGCV